MSVSYDTIAFDNATYNGSTVSSSPATFSHTVGTGTNRVLILGLWAALSSNEPFGIPTYNGVPMTLLFTFQYGVFRPVLVWWLANPASGANTVSLSTSQTPLDMEMYAVSYSGVAQSPPYNSYIGPGVNSSGFTTFTLNMVNKNIPITWSALMFGTNDVCNNAGAGTTRRGQTTTASTPAGYFDSNGVVSGSTTLIAGTDNNEGGIMFQLDQAMLVGSTAPLPLFNY
jgi:hypothetical protein